jgi:putative ABC transport system ATP-binding protein
VSLVSVTSVRKHFGEGAGRVAALDGVSLQVEAGSFLALAGPSGSGKTTLLNLIGCLDQPDEGTVCIEGVDVSGLDDTGLAALRAARIGFVFQTFNLVPVLSAVENVEVALQLSGRRWTDAADRCRKALADVGLEGMEQRRPNQLSGGQQQRVAIARALVKEPALVIADEPTASLDTRTGSDVLDLMREMNARAGVSFVFSSHDPMVLERAARVVHLRDGKRVEG